jgi:fatty acid desaturase
MASVSTNLSAPLRPTLMELGDDLTQLSSLRRWILVLSPFAWSAGYFVLAMHRHWFVAAACLVVLSFITYGSVSHDLVHRNLGFSKRTNDLLLVLIEMLALRSGTAYRLAHLHHHRRFPADDDIEGAAAKIEVAPAALIVQGMESCTSLRRPATVRGICVCLSRSRGGCSVEICSLHPT